MHFKHLFLNYLLKKSFLCALFEVSDVRMAGTSKIVYTKNVTKQKTNFGKKDNYVQNVQKYQI